MSLSHELLAWLDADTHGLRQKELSRLVGILEKNHPAGSFVETVFGRRIRVEIMQNVYPSCSFAK